MTQSLFDRTGSRKYLVARERSAFASAATAEDGEIGAFCLILLFTGARISEVLALTRQRIDKANGAIIIETLKRRKRGMFRAVPVPGKLLLILDQAFDASKMDDRDRLWIWGRTTAWKRVKQVMRAAGIAEALCKPKALRHGFGAGAGQNAIPLNFIQRWLGHARIETSAIYVEALGDEERALARRSWIALERVLIHGTKMGPRDSSSRTK